MRLTHGLLVKLYVTPDELRRLADELEAGWAAVRVGDPVPRTVRHLSGGGQVHIIIDQDAMNEAARGGGRVT